MTREVVGKHLCGSTNWNGVGHDKAKEALKEGIEAVISLAKGTKDDVRGIGLGLSGCDRPEDVTLIEGWMQEILPGVSHVSVTSDAVAALASGTAGQLYGIVIISGTGTITYGFDSKGNSDRAAGWGPTLGDQGDGYTTGLAILKAVTYAVDKRGPETQLVEAVLSHLNLKKPSELIPWAYDEATRSWAKFAALAPLATQCAQNGDAVAKGILQHATDELLNSAFAVIKKLKLEEESFPVVLAGGNLTYDGSVLAGMVKDGIAAKYPNARIGFPSIDIASASAQVAIHRFKI
eukprot:TRINITY_DN2490_c0_g1_i1.p1 TRINITY_DN2490_c0_g1~~TRINITY_DN2490_c0_g1_i1.p1  ORF type:complete len:318 (+),score=77.12 TRINITY_DN2490_c0_g1_i1:80-955(+)